MSSRTGIILLVSGPSGSGKTTLCRRLADEGQAVYSTSCTTRPAREGERHGHDYHFLSREEFEKRITANEFIEYAEVHENLYGTLKSEVTEHIAAGTDVVMDIDVQGANLVRSCPEPNIRTALVELFVMPPSNEELRARLTGRGTDSEDVIELRMKNAIEEMSHWPEYTYCIISATREEDYNAFKALLTAERLKTCRLTPHS